MAIAEERVSRRRLLKRAGIGAAAVGAGSMITATTASADSPPSPECIDVGGCGPFIPCPGDCDCGCVITTEGCCFCMNNVFCAGLTACVSSQQCPPGWVCATGGCGADPGFCVPHCGANSHHDVPCEEALAAGRATWKAGAAGGGGGGGHHEEAPSRGHGGHQ